MKNSKGKSRIQDFLNQKINSIQSSKLKGGDDGIITVDIVMN